MFYYYLDLGLRSLKRDVALTALMIAAIAVGIGASMTTLTVFRAMSGDPIPRKSARLFVPQIDNWGPHKQAIGPSDRDNLQDQISYTDALGLMNAHAAKRQAAMYATGLALTPDDPRLRPFQVHVRATYADFFPMFAVPFRYGGPWSAADDEAHADVVVISRALDDKLFGGANGVGRALSLDDHVYRIVGVIDRWQPIPRFYDLTDDKYGESEEVFMPFTRAVDGHMQPWGNTNCAGDIGSGWDGLLHSECVWIQFWLELPNAAAAAHYRTFLDNYAAEQRRDGRFHWPSHTKLRNLRQWLAYEHAVSDEARILVLVSFSFLFVCLLNAMGLMLAKIMRRSADLGVRRALGANRRAIFAQCLIESGVIGLAGGVLGLALTALGLAGLRSLLTEEIARLTRFGLADTGIAIALGVAATMIAGLYPALRAVQIQPAWQLKSQ